MQKRTRSLDFDSGALESEELSLPLINMDMEVAMDMDTNDETVVQTSLSGEEYERFRSIAERQGKTLKEALNEAAKEYVATRDRPDPDDPFFSYEPTEDGGESVTATKTDDYLYGDE